MKRDYTSPARACVVCLARLAERGLGGACRECSDLADDVAFTRQQGG